MIDCQIMAHNPPAQIPHPPAVLVPLSAEGGEQFAIQTLLPTRDASMRAAPSESRHQYPGGQVVICESGMIIFAKIVMTLVCLALPSAYLMGQ